jgi:hypothetical protein
MKNHDIRVPVLGMAIKESCGIGADDRGVIIFCVLRERFGNKDSRVVDQRVNPTEPFQSICDHALRRFPLRDIALDDYDVRILRGRDRAGGCDYAVVAVLVCPDEGRTDATRSACDNGNLLLDPNIATNPLAVSVP